MGSIITSDVSNQGNPKNGIPWYLDSLERIPPLAERVLVEHAGLKQEEVKDHVMKIVRNPFAFWYFRFLTRRPVRSARKPGPHLHTHALGCFASWISLFPTRLSMPKFCSVSRMGKSSSTLDAVSAMTFEP